MTPPHDDRSGADPTPADAPAGDDRARAATTPAADWSGLTDTLTRELQERIRAAGGDPAKFEEAWGVLEQAYGQRGAYNIVRLRAGQILGVELEPDLAEKLAHLAQSRANFLPRSSAGVQLPALPHEAEEYRPAAGFAMPPQVRVRVEAAAGAMRRVLEQVYEDPVLAEARLHLMAAADRDPASLASIGHEPERLGTLRPQLQDPGAALAPALAHAGVAYELHLAPTADHATDLAAREAIVAVQRAAADIERAAKALDQAIDLHGPALNAHLRELRGEILRSRGPSRGPDWGGGEGPAREDPGAWDGFAPAQGRAELAGAQQMIPAGRTAAPFSADPAVEEAVRAHMLLDEARILDERGRALRAERGQAQSILAVLKFDDAEQLRTKRDVDALAGRVYRHPDRALKRWNALVKTLDGDIERARKIVEANPGRLGALHSEPAGWLATLPLPGWVADSIPFRSTAEARGQFPRFVETGVAYAEAKKIAESPVPWTTPAGVRLEDRAEVRAAALKLEKDHTTEIERNDAALLARGSVAGAERQAQRAIGGLTPEQRADLARKLAAARGVPAAEMSAALSRLAAAPRVALQGARLVRAASEGPGHSL